MNGKVGRKNFAASAKVNKRISRLPGASGRGNLINSLSATWKISFSGKKDRSAAYGEETPHCAKSKGGGKKEWLRLGG